MIEAVGLTKTFDVGRGRIVEAVRGASFAVDKGEIFGLLGPNGAGKTTLLRMLGTIITPTAGHCVVAGIRASDQPDEVRRRIGFLSGNTRLYRRLTAREMLQYFGRLYGMDDPTIDRRTGELADLLDMSAFLDRRCATLSTGQSQKVSIARVILHDPDVLILDEPTLGLDIMTSRTILDFILDARSRGHAVIFSTHYMTEAEKLCDRIAFMHGGRILAVATQAEHRQATGAADMHDAFLAVVQREAPAAT
jgi:sodium transport system ATP-binding protein